MVILEKNRKEPLYMQIYSQLKEEILEDVLKEGQILTGSRGFAKVLNVSRNTVDNAYGQLLAEGYITPKKGIGFVVMKMPQMKVC